MTPYDTITAGSRSTYHTGNAVRLVAEEMRDEWSRSPPSSWTSRTPTPGADTSTGCASDGVGSRPCLERGAPQVRRSRRHDDLRVELHQLVASRTTRRPAVGEGHRALVRQCDRRADRGRHPDRPDQHAAPGRRRRRGQGDQPDPGRAAAHGCRGHGHRARALRPAGLRPGPDDQRDVAGLPAPVDAGHAGPADPDHHRGPAPQTDRSAPRASGRAASSGSRRPTPTPSATPAASG